MLDKVSAIYVLFEPSHYSIVRPEGTRGLSGRAKRLIAGYETVVDVSEAKDTLGICAESIGGVKGAITHKMWRTRGLPTRDCRGGPGRPPRNDREKARHREPQTARGWECR